MVLIFVIYTACEHMPTEYFGQSATPHETQATNRKEVNVYITGPHSRAM